MPLQPPPTTTTRSGPVQHDTHIHMLTRLSARMHTPHHRHKVWNSVIVYFCTKKLQVCITINNYAVQVAKYTYVYIIRFQHVTAASVSIEMP